MDRHEYNVERQSEEEDVLEADRFLAGFFAGLAAAKTYANTTANTSVPDAGALALDDPNTRWPFQDGLAPTPPSNISAPWSHPLSQINGTSSSQAQNISLDHEPHRFYAVQLDAITTSAVDKHLFDFNSTVTAYPPPLNDYRWSHISDGAANSLESQSSFVLEGDVPRNWLSSSDIAASQHNASTLSEPRLLPAELSETLDTPPRSTTDPDPALNNPNWHEFSTTDALIQIGNTFGASTRSPREATPNRQAPEWSLPHVARRLKHTKSSPHSPPSPCVTKQGAQGAIRMVFRAYGSQRSKLNEQSRVCTAMTRSIGACATCRKNKRRCDQSSKDKFVPCDTCARKSPNLLLEPCCRVEIIDIKLFRRGTTTTATLRQWMLSKESGKGALVLKNGKTLFEAPRRVYLTQEINLTTFAVTASRFQPGPDDTTAYVWTDAAGIKRDYKMPPYYITDMAEAGENMRQYARTARPEFTKAVLVNANPIVRKTFEEAERYYTASKSNLVAAALMFWSATRMIERFWLICGDDTLGMSPMEQNLGLCRLSPFYDAIPVTPVMDTQLDELAIKDVLIPLNINLLRLLKAKVLAKKKEHWYEIYLASFIILHNSERVNEHILDFCHRFGVEPQPKSNDDTSLSHAYYHGCKTVLVYFHFASGGAAPLSLDWDDASQDTSVMTHEQIAYLRDIKAELLRQDADLQVIKGASMYENEMYWCHQMFFPDWKADMPHTGRLLEFTEKDFLVA